MQIFRLRLTVEIGIGIPGEASPRDPAALINWATRAEDRGFSSLAAVDRLVFSNFEPLIALAALSAVTTEIRLTTAILISPYRLNTVLLAKQIASLDRLSNGRLVLGVGIGARNDDYSSSGMEPRGRGQRLEEQIETMRTIWGGEILGYAGRVGPVPSRPAGPELLLAGHVPAALRRAGRLGDGWIMGGGTPEQFYEMATQVRASWTAGDRPGSPRTAALVTFSLGANAEQNAQSYLGRYYNFPPDAGDQALINAAGAKNLAEVMVMNTVMTPTTIRTLVKEWKDVGCDELIFLPCSADPSQVDDLADSLEGLIK